MRCTDPRRLLGAFVLALALAGPASAAAPAPHGGGPEAAHEVAAGDHHVDYLGDDDHDGTPNWRDPDHEAYQPVRLAQHAFNLALLLGVLAWAAGRPLSDAIKNRSASIRKELADAQRMRDEAEHRHAELEARLSNFEAEVAAIASRSEADAKAEEERLVERAEAEAVRIGQTAQRNIRDEVVRARMALRAEAVELAVTLAEQTLRSEVQNDDQRRLARQFLDSLHDQKVNGHG